jgi:hypothetical protein
VENKAFTRHHIEDPAGDDQDVVMNVGDHVYKLPNATYYLP